MGVVGAVVPACGVPQGGWLDHQAGHGDEASGIVVGHGCTGSRLQPTMWTRSAADRGRPWGRVQQQITADHEDEAGG